MQENVLRKRGRPRKPLDNLEACELLFNLHRWAQNGYDTRCCDYEKLKKVFPAKRISDLERYFIYHPAHEPKFSSWVYRLLVEPDFDFRNFFVKEMSEIFTQSELNLLYSIADSCSKLE